MNSDNCVCDNKQLVVVKTCGMPNCETSWEETLTQKYQIKYHCLKHKCIMICGPVLKACPSCTSEGYSILAEHGSSTKFFKDGKKIDLNKH